MFLWELIPLGAEILCLKGWPVRPTDRSNKQYASWIGSKRSHKNCHLGEVLGTEYFTYITFSPLSATPLCYSHFADEATEAQRLYNLSKVIQPAVIALGPDGVRVFISLPFSCFRALLINTCQEHGIEKSKGFLGEAQSWYFCLLVISRKFPSSRHHVIWQGRSPLCFGNSFIWKKNYSSQVIPYLVFHLI